MYPILTPKGLETTTKDPVGSETSIKKDYRGLIRKVTEHSETDFHTEYDYSGAGDLLKIKNNLGNETKFTYDNLGNKKSIDDPDIGFWSYTYDPNGNLDKQTDAKQQITQFIYDKLNRIIEKNYSKDGEIIEPKVEYVYDAPNAIGELFAVIKNNVTKEYQYDSMYRVKEVKSIILGAPTRKINYDYDYVGNIKNVTYPDPDNYQITYDYHTSTNLVNKVRNNLNELATIDSYTVLGKPNSISFNNNVTTTYEYDPNTDWLNIIQTKSQGGTDYMYMDYDYYLNGNIYTITDHTFSATKTYEYDKLNRLKNEHYLGKTPVFNIPKTTTYNYGDISKPLHAANSVVEFNVPYEYKYDSNGNMTKGFDSSDVSNIASLDIVYNTENKPTSITHSLNGIIDFTYDGDGVRVKKEDNNGNKTYYYEKYFEVVNDEEIKYIFVQNSRIAMIKKIGGIEKTYFIHKDNLGSTVLLTQEDGEVYKQPEQAEYFPFGAERSLKSKTQDLTAYRFTDQENDVETGLYNYDARLYDPALRMFISPDSYLPNVYDPQQLNRYAYARNNPLKYTDPSGHVIQIPAAVYFWGTSVLASPDLQNDMQGFSESLACGDWVGAGIDVGFMLIPGATNGGKIWRAFGEAAASGKFGKIIQKIPKSDFIADLSKSKAKTRSGHKNAGNKQLHDSMKKDSKLRTDIENKYGNDAFDRTSPKDGRKNPQDGVWHHNKNNKNDLELKTKEDHLQTHKEEGNKGGWFKFWE